jgi:hypothetical protein
MPDLSAPLSMIGPTHQARTHGGCALHINLKPIPSSSLTINHPTKTTQPNLPRRKTIHTTKAEIRDVETPSDQRRITRRYTTLPILELMATGWIAQWDPTYEKWFYVNEKAKDKVPQWDHPGGTVPCRRY